MILFIVIGDHFNHNLCKYEVFLCSHLKKDSVITLHVKVRNCFLKKETSNGKLKRGEFYLEILF